MGLDGEEPDDNLEKIEEELSFKEGSTEQFDQMFSSNDPSEVNRISIQSKQSKQSSKSSRS